MKKNVKKYKTVLKIKIFILQLEKNLIFFFSSKKIKKEILHTKVLRMTRKGKLAKILEHPYFLISIKKM